MTYTECTQHTLFMVYQFYKQMDYIVLLFMFYSFIAVSDCDPCTDNSPLPFLPKRQPSYRTNVGETEICDDDLAEKWYKADRSDMLTSEAYLSECGTLYPVWLREIVENPFVPLCRHRSQNAEMGSGDMELEEVVSSPRVTQSRISNPIPPQDGEEHSLTACVTKLLGNCKEEITIKVKNCGTFNAYYLPPMSSCPRAYCFETRRLDSLSTKKTTKLSTTFMSAFRSLMLDILDTARTTRIPRLGTTKAVSEAAGTTRIPKLGTTKAVSEAAVSTNTLKSTTPRIGLAGGTTDRADLEESQVKETNNNLVLIPQQWLIGIIVGFLLIVVLVSGIISYTVVIRKRERMKTENDKQTINVDTTDGCIYQEVKEEDEEHAYMSIDNVHKPDNAYKELGKGSVSSAAERHPQCHQIQQTHADTSYYDVSYDASYYDVSYDEDLNNKGKRV